MQAISIYIVGDINFTDTVPHDDNMLKTIYDHPWGLDNCWVVTTHSTGREINNSRCVYYQKRRTIKFASLLSHQYIDLYILHITFNNNK